MPQEGPKEPWKPKREQQSGHCWYHTAAYSSQLACLGTTDHLSLSTTCHSSFIEWSPMPHLWLHCWLTSGNLPDSSSSSQCHLVKLLTAGQVLSSKATPDQLSLPGHLLLWLAPKHLHWQWAAVTHPETKLPPHPGAVPMPHLHWQHPEPKQPHCYGNEWSCDWHEMWQHEGW